MTSDDRIVSYLEGGPPEGDARDDRLDLVREILARPAAWAEPPAELQIDGATARVDAGAPDVRMRRGVLTGIAAALLLTIALAVMGGSGQVQGEGTVVAMAGTDLAPGANGTATLRETPSGWYIRLEVSGLPPAPEDSYYEGWVWDSGEGVSIGTFHLRGGTEPVALWSGVDVAEYPEIWVTLEDEDGDPAASDRLMLMGEYSVGD
jgi:hypothetical protein